MKAESLRLPSRWMNIYHIWYRNFLLFRRFWLVSFFWIVFEPLVLFIAIGYGLGTYVTNVKGVSYAEFFFPALLSISSMMVAYFECTYGNFSKMTYQNTYKTMLLGPVEPVQIVYGEALWGATKGTMSAVGVLVVAGLFGHLETFMVIPSIGILFLSSFAFAAFGLLIVTYVKTYDQIIYPTSGFIIPMSLLSETYFPITELPFHLDQLTAILPLKHTVAGVRGLLVGNIALWQVGIHAMVLLILSVVLTKWAGARFHKKLIQ